MKQRPSDDADLEQDMKSLTFMWHLHGLLGTALRWECWVYFTYCPAPGKERLLWRAGCSCGGSDESHPPDVSAVGGKEALKPQVGARKATLPGSPDLRPC